MDEHIVLLEGTAIEFKHDFVDENLNTLASWTDKHNGYSIREAIDLLDIELGIFQTYNQISYQNKQAAAKREIK